MATQEEQNLEAFDRVDFEAWNGPDWDLFRQLHTPDVIVDWAGTRTEGIDAHEEMARQSLAAYPAKIVGHPIKIAQGEWTAVVGEIAGGIRMVTVAKWRDGAIAEEYIFLNSPTS
ncbi:MAG: ester cyclase [Chloroflexota bacterium]|nr:ester cyclase [Chloroflexota bacterium]